jgi:hypothetical protein
MLHATVVAKLSSFYSAIWTASCAVIISALQLVAWVRTGKWKPIAISDALGAAGALPRAHYSTASVVETQNRWSFETIIYWLSEFPLIALLLIVAALLFCCSMWIESYEKSLRGA